MQPLLAAHDTGASHPDFAQLADPGFALVGGHDAQVYVGEGNTERSGGRARIWGGDSSRAGGLGHAPHVNGG